MMLGYLHFWKGSAQPQTLYKAVPPVLPTHASTFNMEPGPRPLSHVNVIFSRLHFLYWYFSDLNNCAPVASSSSICTVQAMPSTQCHHQAGDTEVWTPTPAGSGTAYCQQQSCSWTELYNPKPTSTTDHYRHLLHYFELVFLIMLL